MEGMETHVGRDTTDDDLLLPSCLDRLPEVSVVPSIHFSLALDVRCVGMHRDDLLGQGTVLSWRSIAKQASKPSSFVHLTRICISPVSALVVRIVGRLKTLASSACARTLLFISCGVRSRHIWKRPSWWSTTSRATLFLSMRS